MNKLLNEELNFAVKYLKEKYNDNLLAVYLRGSHLYNLNNENSDLDLLVVVRTNLMNAVTKNLVSKDKKGPEDSNFEYKFMDEYSLVGQLAKGNTTTLDSFLKKPLYMNDDFEEMADLLYDNRAGLFYMNHKGTLNSAYGHTRQALELAVRLSSKGELDPSSTSRLMKAVASMYKSFAQLESLLKLYENVSSDEVDNDTPEFLSFVDNTMVHGELKDSLMSKKNTKVLSENEYNGLVGMLSSEKDKLQAMKDKTFHVAELDLSNELLTKLLEVVAKPFVSYE